MPERYKQTYTNGNSELNLKVAIVGGGLVGALAALHLGKKGHEVNLYEFREDIRTAELVIGRSINLALSARGRKALAEVGLEDALLSHGIPMRGRMLHDQKGKTTIVPYDNNTHQCIYSVGRKHLNEVLLNAAEKYPNINLNFKHRLVGANLEEGKMKFVNPDTQETKEVEASLIIGCDGAYSAIRKEVLKRAGFDYSQKYIEHGYLELCIPPKNGEFQMPHNYLHIWPRGKFMMIALPNQDKSWTVTLFMPFQNFDSIVSPGDLLDFFKEYFPDSIPLIGKDRLISDFFKIKAQPLISVKCHPYHVKDKVLLMGDAAHAMVPFYGQGMNCGFEDCTVLTSLFNKHGSNLEAILSEFSETRWENAHSIVDLAMYNYVEMRDLCTKKSFLFRKKLDEFLYWLMPKTWMPLYNSVSFSHMPYKECIKNRQWQDKVLTNTLCVSSAALLGIIAIAGYRIVSNSSFSEHATTFLQNALNFK